MQCTVEDRFQILDKNTTVQWNFFFHWHYSPLWALACRTISFHFYLSITNSLHLLTPSTWRSLSASSFHPFLGLPLRLVPSSSWVKIFLGILSSSILSRWSNQLILCPFIHFTIFSPLLISSSSRFFLLFHSPFSYLGPYILLNIFLSKTTRVFSSLFVIFYGQPILLKSKVSSCTWRKVDGRKKEIRWPLTSIVLLHRSVPSRSAI